MRTPLHFEHHSARRRMASALMSVADPRWIHEHVLRGAAPQPPPEDEPSEDPSALPAQAEAPPPPDPTAPNPGPASQPPRPDGKRQFQNDGMDKLDDEGNPVWSPNRYRQPGPGDEAAIQRYLAKNPRPTDDQFHTFCRSIGLDPIEGEKVAFALAAKQSGAKQQESRTPLAYFSGVA